MCGIIGFIGGEQAAPILLGGLKKLEYRGYDSAGIAILEDGKIEIAKSKGRLEILSDKIEGGRSFLALLGLGTPGGRRMASRRMRILIRTAAALENLRLYTMGLSKIMRH